MALISRAEEQLVVFRLANEHYALGISTVQEIVVWQQVTRVPKAPEFVEGIINLRGKVIPIIDLRRRFALAQEEAGRTTRIVVVRIGSEIVGLVVDEVLEVLRVARDQVEPPAGITSGTDTDVVRGVAKTKERLIILLDAERLLTDREVAAQSSALTAEVEPPPARVSRPRK